MAKPTAAALKTHITTDPNTHGLMWSLENNQLLALLNQADYGTVTAATMSKNDFLLAIAPAFGVLPTKDATTQAKWNAYLDILKASEEAVRPGNATVDALLDDMVTDTLITQAQRDAIGQRSGTYAETVWGADVKFTLKDIREARNLP